jgi:predicted site-specific integrase-resolvase
VTAPIYITSTDAAGRLGVSPQTITAYCRAGKMGTRIGGRYVLTAAEVARFKRPKRGNPKWQPKVASA